MTLRSSNHKEVELRHSLFYPIWSYPVASAPTTRRNLATSSSAQSCPASPPPGRKNLCAARFPDTVPSPFRNPTNTVGFCASAWRGSQTHAPHIPFEIRTSRHVKNASRFSSFFLLVNICVAKIVKVYSSRPLRTLCHKARQKFLLNSLSVVLYTIV